MGRALAEEQRFATAFRSWWAGRGRGATWNLKESEERHVHKHDTNADAHHHFEFTFNLSATDVGNVDEVLRSIPGEIRSFPSAARRSLLFLAVAGQAMEILLAFGFEGGLGEPKSVGSSFGNVSSR